MILTCSDAAFFFIAKHDVSPKKHQNQVKIHPKRYNLLKWQHFYIRNDVISEIVRNFASGRI